MRRLYIFIITALYATQLLGGPGISTGSMSRTSNIIQPRLGYLFSSSVPTEVKHYSWGQTYELGLEGLRVDVKVLVQSPTDCPTSSSREICKIKATDSEITYVVTQNRKSFEIKISSDPSRKDYLDLSAYFLIQSFKIFPEHQ
jgi:hypothetical protein